MNKFNVRTKNIQGVFINTAVEKSNSNFQHVITIITNRYASAVNYVSKIKSNVNFTSYLYSNVSCAITSINGQTAVLGLMAIGSEK